MTAKNPAKPRKTAKQKEPAVPRGGGRRRTVPELETPIRFETLIAALVMVAAIVILYPGHVFQDKIFFAGDNQAAASFTAAAEKGMEEEDVYPVWNPYLFCGMPSYGSLSYTPYVYPPSAVLTLLVKYLFFPKYIWLFFHTFLTGFGTYLLLRDRRVWFMPALTAGVLMMWMPNLVAVGANGHGSQACAVGYIPFALLFWDRMWRGKGVLVNGAALIIVLGFSMLRGHLQISYYTYALIGLHLLFFGVARIMDGTRGKTPETSILPRGLFAKMTRGGERYSTGSAVVELAWSAVLMAGVVGASLLISAVLYMPVHDYSQYSIRGASGAGGLDYAYATSWSLHPAEMLTFLFPYAFGFGKDLYIGYMPFTDYPNYVGLVVLAGAAAAMVLARSRFVWFLFFVAVVSTLVSFGRFFPILYDPLFKVVPYFNKFRVPVMVLIVQQFALVVMFGIGFDAVLRADPEKGKRNAVIGLAVAFLVFMIVILSQNFWPGGFAEAIAGKVRGARNPQEQIMVARVVGNFLFKDLIRFAIVSAVVFAALFLYFTRRIPGLVFCALVLVLSVVDFYLVDRNILRPEDFRQHDQLRIIRDRSVAERYKEPDDVVAFLGRESRPYRVFPMDRLFTSNRYMVFGISSIGGYHAAKLSLYEEYFEALKKGLSIGNFQVLDILNVRYFISAVELSAIPRLQPVWSGLNIDGEPRYIYENVGAFPRAWQVGSYRVASDEAALNLIGSGEIDLSREAILDREPPVTPTGFAAEETTSTRIEKLGFNEIRVRTDSPSPSILVLSEIYYPDWKAEVDGETAELLRADHVLRGVALEAGEHEVVFYYDMSLLKKSAYISVITFSSVVLVLTAGLIIMMRGRRVGSTHRRADV